ncbi:hypothetical protein D3C78_727990 [compost metagenome]
MKGLLKALSTCTRAWGGLSWATSLKPSRCRRPSASSSVRPAGVVLTLAKVTARPFCASRAARIDSRVSSAVAPWVVFFGVFTVVIACAPAAGLRHDTPTTQLMKDERKYVEPPISDRFRELCFLCFNVRCIPDNNGYAANRLLASSMVLSTVFYV